MQDEILTAIHQPTFFSWLGYFDKIVRSDIFVILDSVQFPKTGGYWANRVKILINGNENWITIPIIRSYSGTRLIKEMEINNSTPWRDKMLGTINFNYIKAPFYSEVFPLVKDLIGRENGNLCEYNLSITYSLCELLGINSTKMVRSSALQHEGTATDLLVSILKLTGGTVYMCGGGASNYQEDEKFEDAGIKLIYQNFQHPVYQQFNTKEFVPGLSILDSLMNLGVEGVRDLINSGKDK